MTSSIKKTKFHRCTAVLLAVVLTISSMALYQPANQVMADTGSGTTYYVSNDGDDDNPGTSPEQAWKTLEKVNEQEFEPGDSILFERGGTWNGQLWPKGSGSAGDPILLSAYGEGNRPVINGNGTGASINNNTHENRDTEHMQFLSGAVQLVNEEYWEISSLEVTNFDADYNSHRAGILVYNYEDTQKNYIRINDCYVHDVYPTTDYANQNATQKMTGGILVIAWNAPNHGGAYATAGDVSNGMGYSLGEIKRPDNNGGSPGFNDVIIENNYVEKVAKEGIRNKTTKFANNTKSGGESYPKTNTDVIIRNNYIYDVFGDAIVLSEVASGGVVENNVINKHTQTSNGNFAACWVHYSDGSLFQYNEVFNGINAYADGEAFDIDNSCNNTTFQYNYSHNNYGGFFLTMGPQYNSTIRYNVSVNDGFGGQEIFFYWQNGSNGATSIPAIYNNTIYTGKGVSTSLFAGDNPIQINFQNNIVLSHGDLKSISRRGINEDTSIVKNNNFYPASIVTTNGFSDEFLEDGDNLHVDPQLAAPQLARDHDSLTYALDEQDTTSETMRERLNIFKLREGSPMIDAGTVVDGAPDEDIFGNKLTDGKPDIGAHEYSGDPSDVTADDEIMPESISIDRGIVYLLEGDSVRLNAVLAPEEMLAHSVVYESSDETVATVSKTGMITAVKEGKAVIRAIAEADDTIYEECEVNVVAAPDAGDTYSLIPDDDAYVRDGSSANTNYGSNSVLEIKSDGSGYARKAYIKFTVPKEADIKENDRVFLNLGIDSVNDDASRTVTMYSTATDWSESTLTWNTVPANIGDKVMEFDVVTADAGNVVTLDITDFIMENLTDTERTFSFGLVNEGTASSKGDFSIHSKEADAEKNWPYMSIEPISVKSVNDIELTTGVGNAPKLPESLEALYNDGSTGFVPVEWDEIPEENYAKAGKFYVAGWIDGLALPVLATVQVLDAQSIEMDMTTSQGKYPSLSATVEVTYDDGSKGTEKAIWDYVPADAYNGAVGTEFFVFGTTENGFSVQMAVTVTKAAGVVRETLTPAADDYAQENNGTRDSTVLRLKNYTAAYHRTVFLKFNIDELDIDRYSVDNVTLRLYVKGMDSVRMTWFNVYVTENDWQEGGTMQWASMPSQIALIYERYIVDGTTAVPEYVDIPLGNVLHYADENGDITFQLLIEENPDIEVSGPGSNSGIDFYSKDNGDDTLTPQLFIDNTYIAETENVDITIKQGQSFTLPDTIQATMSDNSQVDYRVSWEDADAVDTNTPGLYPVYGQLGNSYVKVKAEISVESTADKTDLNAAIQKAKDIIASGEYAEDDAMVAYKLVLEEAEALAANPYATESEISQMLTRLENAEKSLNEKQSAGPDTRELEKEIANAKNLVSAIEAGKYYEDGLPEFYAALAAAEEAALTATTQEEVDAALRRLQKARMALRLKPSREALEELVKEMEEIDPADYTPESYAALAEAITAAKAVLGNPNATTADIRSAQEALQQAKDQLVPVSAEPDPDPETPSAPSDEPTSSESEKITESGSVSLGGDSGNAGTGDNGNFMTYLSLLFLAAAGSAVLLKKKYSQK